MTVQVKPSRAVFVNCEQTKGEPVLVPYTRRIIVSEQAPPQVHATAQKVDYRGANVVLSPDCGPEFVVPFWAVRPTTDESSANAMIQTRTVYFIDPATGERMDIGIPIMTNKRKLKIHEEVVVHRPAATTVQAPRRGRADLGETVTKKKQAVESRPTLITKRFTPAIVRPSIDHR